MKLRLKDDLLFVTMAITHGGRRIEVAEVLVDAGAARTLLATDVLAPLGVMLEGSDRLHEIRGVGGAEVVFRRRLERLEVGPRGIADFEVEVGGMTYGFEMNGILGMDFLRRTGAVLDLADLTLRFGEDKATAP